MHRSLSFLLFCCVFCVCPAWAQDSVKLSGTIEHPKAETIKITYNDNYLAYYPQTYTATVDKKGMFKMTFPVPKGNFVQAELNYGDKLAEVLVRAGDSLYLKVNTLHFDSSIHYYGRGADIQNFIALHTNARGRMNQYTLKIKEAINNEPDDFLKAIAAEYNNETNFLKTKGNTLPAPFANYWKAFYLYYNYFFMQQYPQMHEIVRLRRFTDTIPEQNYKVVNEMPLAFNDSLLQLPPYLLYLTGVQEAKLKAAGYTWVGKDTVKAGRLEDSVYTLAYTTLPAKSAEYYVAQSIYGKAKAQQLARTEYLFARFKARWGNSSYLPLMNKQVGLAKKLAPGQPAPDFTITTADGQQMKLSDLKGKVVYLGFWAGWCRQCVGEMLNEKKMKDLLKKKPVAFVYVSLSADTATEKTLIEHYKIDGIFTTEAAGWDSKVVQAYGVQNLPAYYLIDKEGNFAAQSVPTPMQILELVQAIEKLF